MKKYNIRTEQPRDFKIVENLTREAFWNVYRPGCVEHFVLHHYRNDPSFIPELSLVMEVDGQIIGHVMYAWSKIDADDGRKIRMMTFGPISIHPTTNGRDTANRSSTIPWNSRAKWAQVACSSSGTSDSTARADSSPLTPRASATPTTRTATRHTSCARNSTRDS